MTGEHIGHRAVAYGAGDLPDAERDRIAAHLDECAECQAEVEQIRVGLGAVRSWPRNPQLPAALEERIVRAAVASGRHRAVESDSKWWYSRAAAALLLSILSGAIGFGAGRLTSASERPGQASAAGTDSTLHSYLLLLEEPSWPPAQPLARAGYGDWARAIAAESRFVGAEKLTEDPGFRVRRGGESVVPVATAPNFSGWYVVRARNYDEAIAWARRGPHLAYGSVLVREIENTPSTPSSPR